MNIRSIILSVIELLTPTKLHSTPTLNNEVITLNVHMLFDIILSNIEVLTFTNIEVLTFTNIEVLTFTNIEVLTFTNIEVLTFTNIEVLTFFVLKYLPSPSDAYKLL